MNFRQLEYVIAVDRHKHFAKAAESCDVTQATLSAMIKRLEAELGFILFDRTTHPIQTTEEGLMYINKARSILKLQDEMLAINDNDTGSLSGELHLAVIPTIASSLLHRVIPDIIKEFRELRLVLHEMTTEEIVTALESDDIDAGILATPLEGVNLEEHIMYYESMMVYGVKSSHRKYIAPEEIESEKIWLLEEGNCFRDQSMTVCKVKEISGAHNRIQFEGSSFETVLNMAEKFGGYSLIPELYYLDMSEKRQKRARSFRKPYPVREISLVHYRRHSKARSLSLLASIISEKIKPHLISQKLKLQDMSVIGIR